MAKMIIKVIEATTAEGLNEAIAKAQGDSWIVEMSTYRFTAFLGGLVNPSAHWSGAHRMHSFYSVMVYCYEPEPNPEP